MDKLLALALALATVLWIAAYAILPFVLLYVTFGWLLGNYS